MKTRKPLCLTLITFIVAALMLFAVACGDDGKSKTYTITFVTYGGTEIAPITAMGGSMIVPPQDPKKNGSTFGGWYLNDKFGGEAQTIPNIMPNKNVTYYAKFDSDAQEYTLTYEYNLGSISYDYDIPPITVAAGDVVTVEDGSKYRAAGHKFMGWSTFRNGLVTVGDKQDGQYNAGDTITMGAQNITLYAQWAVEYTDAREQSKDKIYVYSPLIGKGSGAAVLVRNGKPDAYGFIAAGSTTQSGEDEFTFYGEEWTDGEMTGRLYSNRTFAAADGVQGEYLYYDYVSDDVPGEDIMALDGFGFATYMVFVGDMLSVSASGTYTKTEYDDYLFTYVTDKDGAGAEPQYVYFMLERHPVDDTEFSGLFSFQGLESGSFDCYENGELLPYGIELNGYGGARLLTYDSHSDDITETVEGTYEGTDDYESYYGEWKFIPSDTSEQGFSFILSSVPISTTEYLPIFIMYNENYAGTFKDVNGSDSLYLDGYGSALYTANNVDYYGECTVSESGLVTFVPYIENSDGTVIAGGKTFFNLNRTENTFTVNTDGYIVDDGKLTAYKGSSAFAVIPDTVTEIENGVFNYANEDGVSLISVIIPASVTVIGDLAFQNNYTLRRATFLSENPDDIQINFGSGKDPFRWPAGDFVIVVPEGSQDDYKAAWTDCTYPIMGSTEVTILPEYQIADGVLVRYNKPNDAEDELLDLIIPDEVTEIAEGVFLGLDFIKSVDLNNVTTVGEKAFYGCVNLETVVFTNVQTVGAMAFAACEKLSSSGKENVVELPAIVTIGESAFSGCEKLRLLRLGEDLQSIDNFAFYQCNIYETDPPLVVELMGETAPTMGTKVTLGNIAFRFLVQNMDVALNCFDASSWKMYCRHLILPVGDEEGMYISGSDTLELNGRAVYQGSTAWLYDIDGQKITFYEYDATTATYTKIEGEYEPGKIKLRIGGKTRTFALLQDTATYTTADGKYMLVCDPMDLQPDSYENFSGDADVIFNGKTVKLHIVGYNTKTISDYTDADGKVYLISISFDGETMVVTKKLAPTRLVDITAADGSKITLLFDNGKVYVEKAEFKIKVDNNTYLYWTEATGSGVIATQNGNVYTFTFNHRVGNYRITVTVSNDGKTFTYTYELQ